MGVMSISFNSATSHRIGITIKPEHIDPKSRQLLHAIREFLKLPVDDIKIIKVYSIYKLLSEETLMQIANGLLMDSVLEMPVNENVTEDYEYWIEIGFKPGVTDNAGKTAQLTIEDFLGQPFEERESVRTSTAYLLKGQLSEQDLKKIAQELLGNTLIEDISYQPLKWGQFEQNVEREEQLTGRNSHSKNDQGLFETIDLNSPDTSLEELSAHRQLALNLPEMRTIRDYYSKKDVQLQRQRYQLPPHPTDVELEAIAQTWSEHCKHKIFNAKILYKENGHVEEIDSLFKTYIKRATESIAEKIDWLVSVFVDNAGIIRFNDTYNLAFKVETHNSPSALDPYGGALTGILGVNRDVMGAGIGARLIANTDVFCFAPPTYQGKIPPRLMHPQRIFEGVRRGVEHGGNKTGTPTVNGAIVFDERYLGKPLVYCGSVGIMPAKIHDRPTHHKEIYRGDLIVIAGGRTGKDGIHGATFSSEELHAGSPSSAVQIGDPFTQKKLQDFLLEARDADLYHTLTDNGAGGLSSSAGELARISNGCEIHLERVPLKYPGLRPWEILLSESQERMTLAVAQDHLAELEELAALHEVEVMAVGTFTDTGYFHVLYEQQTVAYLSLEFLHEGVPQLNLEAEWEQKNPGSLRLPADKNYAEDLHKLLGTYNICSKEAIIRQYDHEVQGGSLLKPLVGVSNDGPSDAAIICPVEFLRNSRMKNEAIAISNGICPRYSEQDTYHMTACALDEALRNLVAVGCDPAYIAILDNFCWPDPIYDPKKTPDGKYKLAQLVRSNKALYDYATAFETPIISGKDSMKNDYKIGNIKISIPPTLLISAFGKIHNIEKAISMDVKCPGDFIYILGMTKNELGFSEYAGMKQLSGGSIPHVNVKAAKKSYAALHQAIQGNLAASCHDCSDGGLAVALAEMAFAGGYGLHIDLKAVPEENCSFEEEILFSESASRLLVTVNPKNAASFENSMKGCILAKIGHVREDSQFIIKGLKGHPIIQEDIFALKASWQKPL
jgi:phosphoribosylformylglycinamidine synthase subunit PurSL